MFIRTIKEFNKQFKETDLCAYCGHRLYAPPVIAIDARGYHANCGMQLAWRLLFSVTGEPDLRPIQRVDLEESQFSQRQQAPGPLIISQRRTEERGADGEPASQPGDQ